ncbi:MULTISPECIES: baseplate J/gp47 family protein [Calothrix]|uniref:Baseplate J/gp47 family protein n=2 Tax=Calothrix TaxID=1186 RepID=A0ABR8A9L6_9CYAN|nr:MULTISPECIES: baseplate J/gp47 family protein [Calothrix]MBD2196621.1 baseplate J/gp47 family protein [Calothrix parietina FACHB-288]MBD2228014.1 baseplate J/gp47 family protein [Calothrix anomala FACHB-343]
MTDISSIPLDTILLDDRDEESIVSQAQLRVYNASGGQLNDFSENSPVAALIQGQAFAASEFLYHVNKLPLALVVDFLKVTGVEQSLGTKAVTTLTFTLTAPQSTPFTIPEGFEVVDSSGQYSFFTDATLQIPPGLIAGSVTATAEEVGSKYNLPAYTITRATQPLSFLSSITNVESSSGGTDAETLDQTISRGLTELRIRNLVSEDDYEVAAETILGEGSVAKAIGLLSRNKNEEELGAVHLFLLNANQEPANDAQVQLVSDSLSRRIQLGTQLYISPMELINISASLIAKVTIGANVEQVINDLWEAYKSYLNPSTYPVGQDIILNEVEYHLRLTEGIKNIQTLSLNGSPTNIVIPNQYSLPYPYSLFVQLLSEDRVIYESLRGAGESETFIGEL